MLKMLLLFLLPYVAQGQWRCQDGRRALCDRDCTEESSTEVPALDIPNLEIDVLADSTIDAATTELPDKYLTYINKKNNFFNI